MILNKVTLENYRCHEKLTTEFSRGVNLLLGDNGAGKSSVLEAVGFALFNADLRENSTQSEAIRKGQKRAVITVDFEGIDGKEYRVSRQIGAPAHHRLTIIGMEGVTVEGREEVLTKIRELTGISANEKNIYENVITAAQNKLVGIFLDTPARREEIFNQIFNTGIYRQMYKHHLKIAFDRYKSRLALKEQEIETLSGTLSDPKILKTELKQKTGEQKVVKAEVSVIKKEIAALKKETGQLEKVKLTINRLQEKLSHTGEILKQTEENLKNAENAVTRSEESARIVKNNEEDHRRFETVSKEIAVNSKELNALQQCETEKSVLSEQLKKTELSQKELENVIKAGQAKQIDREGALKEQSKETAAADQQRTDIIAQINKASTALQAGRALEEELEAIHHALKEQERCIADLDNTLKVHQQSIAKEASLQKKQMNLNDDLKTLTQFKKDRDTTTGEITSLETRLEELEQNREALEQGSCPFFLENCLNIGQNRGAGSYFDEKKKIIGDSITKNRKTLEIINKEICTLEGKESEYKKIALELEQLEALKTTVENLEKEKLLLQDKEALLRDNFRLNLKESALLDELDRLDELATLTRLKEDNAAQRTQVEELEKRAADLSLGFDALQEKEASLKQEIQQLKIEITKAEQNLTDGKAEIIHLEKQLAALNKKLTPLSDLRVKRIELEELQIKLKPAHDLYSKNSAIAGDLNKHRTQADKERTKLDKSKSDERELKAALDAAEESFDTEKLIDKTARLGEASEVLEEKVRLETAIAHSIGEITTRIQENSNRLEEISKCEIQKAKINRRMELTHEFRSRINEMGRLVAEQFLEQLELLATDNFRRITGRTEHIRWINAGKEAYALHLCKEEGLENSSKFNILSGGEQVAVALSLRAAMASFFSKSNFAIFDEPTINLDVKRRAALAENLSKLLKELGQAIIVTHDDTFREMAQKVISF